MARHRQGHFHPYAGPGLGPGRQGRRQQQRGPAGPRRRRFSGELGERSPPVPHQRVRSLSGQWDLDGRSRLRYQPETSQDTSWLQRVREEEPGSGDHARRLPWLRF